MALTIAQRELEVFIRDGTSTVLASKRKAIQQNLLRKMGNHTFDFDQSKKAWKHLTDAGAKEYEKDFGGSGTFTVADRKTVADEFAKDFSTEVRQGKHSVIMSKKSKRVVISTNRPIQTTENRFVGSSASEAKRAKSRPITQKQLDRGR